MKVLALINAAAGTVEQMGEEALRQTLVSEFQAEGVEAEIAFTKGERLRHMAEGARDRALLGELDGIVVGGGDGTVSAVANVLAGTHVPLGVLPLGTLNHFARDLRIPIGLAGAVAAIARAEARAVDVAEVNGRVFVNNCSIGLYPLMVLERNRRPHLRGRAKWSSMAFALVQVLRYFPVRRLRVRVEGRARPHRTPVLLVANNRYNLAGPALGARERLDRGELCLYISKQLSRFSLIRLAFRCALGFLDEARDLSTFVARTAEIATRRKHLLVAVDGEVDLIATPLNFRIRPGALQVLALVPVEGEPASRNEGASTPDRRLGSRLQRTFFGSRTAGL
jgi:diacylglycerol kinase family enzyme